MPPWTVTRTSPLTKACAIGYDAAADLPWFLGSRQDFARNAPWPTFFRFICTTRSSSSWTESMIHHGLAGGRPLYDFISSLNLSQPGKYPYNQNRCHNSSICAADDTRTFLSAFHQWHERRECKSHELLNLDASDALKWATLCRHVPTRYAERCEAIRRAGACWPSANGNGHESDRTSKCRRWPHGACTIAAAQLPANRSRSGSITGGWTELKSGLLRPRLGSMDSTVVECG